MSGTESVAVKPTTGRQDDVITERRGNTVYRPKTHSVIDAPDHYTWHPVAECKDVVQEFSYNVGTAMAYLWRSERKNGVEDLKKAIKHIEFEIERMEKGRGDD